MFKYLTTQEAVALNMAAKHGSKVRGKLEGFFKGSGKDYVRHVGSILIHEQAQANDPFLPAAQELAKQVVTKRPLEISIVTGRPQSAKRRASSKGSLQSKVRLPVPFAHSIPGSI